MASFGFKKEVLGFKRNDVLDYIDSMHRLASSKEADLNKNLNELTSSLNSAEEKICVLNNQIEAYEQKRDEIEKISESIGKMYLVAKTNAMAILENAERSSKISDREVNVNIENIESAHEQLQTIENEFRDMAKRFSEDIAILSSSLDMAKNEIGAAKQDSDSRSVELHEIVK